MQEQCQEKYDIAFSLWAISQRDCLGKNPKCYGRRDL